MLYGTSVTFLGQRKGLVLAEDKVRIAFLSCSPQTITWESVPLQFDLLLRKDIEDCTVIEGKMLLK